ncbi:MAG: hypothetical protein ABIR67_02815 [Gaiellaceae bacterium]
MLLLGFAFRHETIVPRAANALLADPLGSLVCPVCCKLRHDPVPQLSCPAMDELTGEERQALVSVPCRYFKRFAWRVAELADDISSYALVERERYLGLHLALRKLGVRLAVPDELRRHVQPLG